MCALKIVRVCEQFERNYIVWENHKPHPMYESKKVTELFKIFALFKKGYNSENECLKTIS